MKPNRAFWLFLMVVIIVVPSLIMWNMYKRAVSDHGLEEQNMNLAQSLNQVAVKAQANIKTQLPPIEATIKLRQDQLAAAQNDLQAQKAAAAQAIAQFPVSIAPMDYDELLFGLAAAAGVDVTSLTTSEPAAETIGSTGFSSTTFTIDVHGTVPKILDLVNRLVASQPVRTGQFDGVTFVIPPPVAQADKDAMTAKLRADRLALAQARVTTAQQIGYTEQAILDLLGVSHDEISLDAMTKIISDTISAQLGQKFGQMFADTVARAIVEKSDSKTLIGIFAGTYGKAIGDLFQDGDPQLMPQFHGGFGGENSDTINDDINAALQKVPPGTVGATVTDIIATALTARVDQRTNEYVQSIVDYSGISAQVAAFVAEAEKASATITLKITVFPGR